MRKNYSKMLSLPPYISTAWENVHHLQMDSATNHLMITLDTGTKIIVPDLTGPVIEEIFQAHAEYIEQQVDHHHQEMAQAPTTLTIGLGPQGLGIQGIEGFSGVVQHDPTQASAPAMPPELLDKIAEVAGGLGVDFESLNLSPGEPHCNCPYCQISKAIYGKMEPIDILPDVPEINTEALKGESVPTSELTFREWDIEQISEQLYKVASPLDPAENYQVFLGHPVGCTCGSTNCAHILAVLQT